MQDLLHTHTLRQRVLGVRKEQTDLDVVRARPGPQFLLFTIRS